MAGFQELKVQRQLEFSADGNNRANIKGHPDEVGIHVRYDFTELALDNTNKYTPFIDTTGTVALGSGGLTLTTAATDALVTSQSQGGIWWYPAKNCTVEMKFKIDIITTVAIYSGFTDAVSEASGLLPHGIVGSTQTATASDSAGFHYDVRQTLAYWNIVNSKAAGAAKAFTQLASTYVPVAATDVVLRVAIDTSGNARYYYNGIQVGYKATAVTTTTPLIPYCGIRNTSATAHVLTLRRVDAWQD